MATSRKLNKELWTNITRLKLLASASPPNRFVLDLNPFSTEDDTADDDAVVEEKDHYVVTGRIYPLSDIYKETALRIEMKITSAYPQEAPVVRFLTPVYHPNVEADGTFCHQLLNNKARWSERGLAALIDVVRVVVQHIDKPNLEYPANSNIGYEYMYHKTEFDRKARSMVQAHALSRN